MTERRTFRERASALDLLQFYAKFLTSSPAQHSVTLKLLQYTCAVLADNLLRLGSGSGSLSSSSSSTSTATALRHATEWLSQSGTSFRQLAAKLSEALYVQRFLGWPAALEAALTNSWAVVVAGGVPSSSSSVTRGSSIGGLVCMDEATLHAWIGRLLAYSMLLYYPLEHAAFFGWYVSPSKHASRYSSYSCRAWAIYLLAEFAQCFLQLRRLQQLEQVDGYDNDHYSSEEQRIVQQRQIQQQKRKLRLRMVRDMLQLVPCLHWSLPDWDTKPFLPTSVVNMFMWVDAMIHQYESYQSFVLAQPPQPIPAQTSSSIPTSSDATTAKTVRKDE